MTTPEQTSNTEAVVEVTKFAIDKLDSYFLAAQEVIAKYGGDAIELGLNVLRVDAVATIFGPLIISVLIGFACLHLNKVQVAMKTNHDDWPDARVFTVIGLWCLLCILVLISVQALNLWAWVGIFYPEIYAVHKFIL